jgi:alpha-beta hydrolase superfamily lysophospholipase
MNKIVRHAVLLISYGLVFSLLGGLTGYTYLSTRFTTKPWHEVTLNEEFTTDSVATIPDFNSYRKREELLFKELREKVYQTSGGSGALFNRYASGSRSDSFGYEINWNRSFELAVDSPRGGMLMLHGLTDSPYSVRSLAENFHAQGFWVVGLRLPGHGTIPAELTRIKWQDWAAASNLGASHVRERIGPDLPFYIVGYSNGGALAVEYSLRVLYGENIPQPAGLVLISPELGLPAIASMAKFQSALSRLPGLEKLAWQSVMMEYDPFKYNSFPVNAGEQAYRLTEHIQAQLEKLKGTDKLHAFPRVLAFQSIVDATIKAEGVVDNLLNRLPPGGHSLVLYDVNQMAQAENLLAATGEDFKSRLLSDPKLPFELTLVTNVTKKESAVTALHKKAMQASVENRALPFSWPQGIYSLSHVALPFPPDDPIYGDLPLQGSAHIRLGKFEIRGEKGVFVIPETNLIRLRYNPFYPLMKESITMFLELPK